MQNYSTEVRVRLEAWFTNNSAISVPTIQQFEDQATAIINGIISRRYDIQAMLSDPTFPNTNACTLLARCEELLWAGHLLNKHYDTQNQTSNSNGDKRIEDAYRILNDIMAGNILLTNATYTWGVIDPWTGSEYATTWSSSAGTPVAYPIDDADRDFTKTQQR